MAQVTHQGVDISTVHIAQVVQIGEDHSCHLQIECVNNDKLFFIGNIATSSPQADGVTVV